MVANLMISIGWGPQGDIFIVCLICITPNSEKSLIHTNLSSSQEYDYVRKAK